MDPGMAAEHGMSKLDESRLDITHSPRHHTLPQEEIAFFQARGFPGRDIDNFTVELDELDHEMVHGDNRVEFDIAGRSFVHYRESAQP